MKHWLIVMCYYAGFVCFVTAAFQVHTAFQRGVIIGAAAGAFISWLKAELKEIGHD